MSAVVYPAADPPMPAVFWSAPKPVATEIVTAQAVRQNIAVEREYFDMTAFQKAGGIGWLLRVFFATEAPCQQHDDPVLS